MFSFEEDGHIANLQCDESNCFHFAEFNEYDRKGSHIGSVCKIHSRPGRWQQVESRTWSKICRRVEEWWDIAKELGWKSPYPLQRDPDPLHHGHEYPERSEDRLVDNTRDAIDYIVDNFPAYLKGLTKATLATLLSDEGFLVELQCLLEEAQDDLEHETVDDYDIGPKSVVHRLALMREKIRLR